MRYLLLLILVITMQICFGQDIVFKRLDTYSGRTANHIELNTAIKDTVPATIVYVDKSTLKVDSGFVVRTETSDVIWYGNGKYSPVFEPKAWIVRRKCLDPKVIIKVIY